MIGFSIMMWFCSAIIIIVSISLLKGNYSGMHGKVFDHAEDKEGYAKAVGKPALLLGIGIGIDGILGSIAQGLCSIMVSLLFLTLLIIVVGLWLFKVQKRFRTGANLSREKQWQTAQKEQ